ncbi:MAG: DUF5615 family PIN-like protein [Saprospiraceae bacterium]|jgi:predicted nuclease of predicted toxin-antitoxin system|nr:DUF5615 family PIN-like protein [Saprospiraceae bacterium]
MLKFVLDVGVGNKTLQLLRNEGFDVISILEIEPSMDDSDILSIAEKEERMVVTMDKDFGELVYRSGRNHNGVLLLRLEDATGDEKAEIMRKILLSFSEQIEGRFCVFQNGRLRIR